MIKVYHNKLGLVDLQVVKIDNAVKQYDERLFLDIHPETGDWVVMIEMERPMRPYPVMGFQKSLPEVHEVLKQLRMQDSQREKIRDNIIENNKRVEREADHKVKEQVGEGAELAEYIMRREGRSPVVKSTRKVTPKKKG